MWWLDSETRSIPMGTRSLPPRRRRQVNAPTGKQPTPAQSVRQTVPKRPILKCTSPLIDTLTAEQEAANRVLSQVQCGHEVEIERLLTDVGSLENTIRKSALKLESQQASIEEKESLLRLAEEKAETLQCSLAEFDGEVQRLDAELQTQGEIRFAAKKHHEDQIAQCDYRAAFAEHRLAELSTVVHHQLADAKKHAATWQLETQRSHASRKALAEQMRQERAIANEKLQRSESQRKQLADNESINESILVQKEQEISELMRLHDELADAKKRAATWQLETQRSHASRRALAEQMRRQKAVDDDALLQSDSQRKQMDQKQQVARLRIQRLLSENLQLEKSLLQEGKIRSMDRRMRESETSEVQSSVREKAIQIDQLKTSIELRDREIIGLKDTVAATEVEIHAAWLCSEEAANQLQFRDAELQRARENEERFVQIQADQAKTLQMRIDTLISGLDSARETSLIDLESYERTVVELEGMIDQLATDQGQLKKGLNLAQQTNTLLVHESAKTRAQLSGGRAKGRLLIKRYEDQLRQAILTLETLRTRAQLNASHGRAA